MLKDTSIDISNSFGGEIEWVLPTFENVEECIIPVFII